MGLVYSRTFILHKNQPNAGKYSKYTIRGWHGLNNSYNQTEPGNQPFWKTPGHPPGLQSSDFNDLFLILVEKNAIFQECLKSNLGCTPKKLQHKLPKMDQNGHI